MFYLFLILITFLSSTYTFRMHFEGYLLGDPFDTRLLVSQLEHWFRFFKGEWDFRDTNFFYPFDKALGFTDAYLLPGIPYSFLREISLSPVDSWFIVSFLLFLIGNLGWVHLARKIFENKIIQISFIWFIITFPTFTILAERATQILTFSWISWLVFLALNVAEDLKVNKKSNSLAGLFLLFPLLMLTSWYPAFFFVISLLAVLTMYLILNRKTIRKTVNNKLTSDLFKPTLFFLPLSIFLIIVWGYIYLPLLGESSRSWPETIYYSSYLHQVLNQTYLNNGWYFYFLKDSEFNAFDKSNVALPWLVILISLIYVIKSFWIKSNKIINYRNIVLIPVAIIFIIFLRLTEEFSIYKVFWENIPGLQSIRFPYRYIIIFGFVLIIFIFLNFDYSITRLKDKKYKYLLAATLLILFSLDNLKPPYAIWKNSEYLASSLESQVTEIQDKCDFFILDKPGGWWDDQISAMAITAISGIPTANGYSGGFPADYPVKPWNFEGDISEILAWSKFGVSPERGCLVSDSHELIISNPSSGEIFFHSGFSPEESNSTGAKWRWAEASKGYVIVNTPKNKNNLIFRFDLKIPDCLINNKIRVINLPKDQVMAASLTSKSQTFEIELPNSPTGINQLTFEVDDFSCTYPGDSRNLYFEIKNYEIVEIN